MHTSVAGQRSLPPALADTIRRAGRPRVRAHGADDNRFRPSQVRATGSGICQTPPTAADIRSCCWTIVRPQPTGGRSDRGAPTTSSGYRPGRHAPPLSIRRPYNPAAALSPKVVKRVLALEFVEMFEEAATLENTMPARLPGKPLVKNILVWLGC